jgi:enterochelin esterase-like enzyme
MHPTSWHLLRAVVAAAAIAPALTSGQARRPVRVAALEAAIAEIEQGRATTPVVGDATAGGDFPVTFLARRVAGRLPRIVSDVTGWGEHVDGTFDAGAGRMTRVGRTAWYSLEARVAPGARIEYQIAYGTDDYRLDPHNPRRVGPPPASEFVTPGYEPPIELLGPPPSPAGVLTETTVESGALRAPCRVVVYTPAGYGAAGRSPVAVVLDARARQMARVMDWLIAHEQIEPIVAAFVELEPPGGEPPRDAPQRSFLARELPAWLAARYGVTAKAAERAVLAISYGARDALDAAIATPDGFGRLGLLIPGRRIGPADIAAIQRRSAPRLRVAILAGRYDEANLETARRVRQALAGAGHAVHYLEVPEGHSPRTWLHHLRGVLVSLFGPSPPAGAGAAQVRASGARNQPNAGRI